MHPVSHTGAHSAAGAGAPTPGATATALPAPGAARLMAPVSGPGVTSMSALQEAEASLQRLMVTMTEVLAVAAEDAAPCPVDATELAGAELGWPERRKRDRPVSTDAAAEVDADALERELLGEAAGGDAPAAPGEAPVVEVTEGDRHRLRGYRLAEQQRLRAQQARISEAFAAAQAAIGGLVETPVAELDRRAAALAVEDARLAEQVVLRYGAAAELADKLEGRFEEAIAEAISERAPTPAMGPQWEAPQSDVAAEGPSEPAS